MNKENTKKVNQILARAFFYCSGVLFILLALIPLGIFNFSTNIILTILLVGIPATVGPIIILKLGISDEILKWYMLVMISILIGLLGAQNGIGIYITYILVPLASCLYFSRRFTLHIGIFGYFTMMVGVYYNCFGKMEVIYKGWSHWIAFRNYMIGFTLEYVIIMVFLLVLVDRSQKYFEIQEKNIKLQQDENDRQRKITDFYVNALKARKTSVYDAISSEMKDFTTEDFVKMASGHRFNTTIQDILKSSDSENDAMKHALENIGDFFGIYRIYLVEPDESGQSNKISYSWAKSEKYRLNTFYQGNSDNDNVVLARAYDKRGYIEMDPENIDSEFMKEIDCGTVRYILSISIGTQVWIPALLGGNYAAVMCFERMGSNKPFSNVDILLLSDIVSTVSMYVFSRNADRANKAKSAFLSSMSHEIRTPMNAILGMTEVALRDDMNSNVRRCLNIIKSSSEGLLAIINDILDFSKIESGRVEVIPEDYYTLSLINDVKTIAEARNIEKGLELNFHVPEDLPSVLHGDMVRIKQVMVNLVNNAIKYTDHGSVNVYVEQEKNADGSIMLEYRVEDTGMGIKDSDKKRMFTSFSQFDQDQNHHKEGTGLGLAISKQLVELMGGAIGFDSQYGKGSMFFFVVPQIVVDDEVAGKIEEYEYKATNDTELVQFTAPGANVLIVDDNSVNRVVAESMFSVFKMNITLADGGNSAIELTKKNKYDLIFMDHLMPDLNGPEATKIIRNDENNPNHDTAIVALTADAVTGVKEKMLASGMNDFLSKPIDMNQATEIMKKYLSNISDR